MGEFYTSISSGHAVSVLIYLRSGTKMHNDLIPYARSTQTLQRLLRDLKDDRLITVVEKTDGHRHYDISLSPLGEKVSENLVMATMLISKDLEPAEMSLDMVHADPILRYILAKRVVKVSEIMRLTHSFIPSKNVLSLMLDEGLILCADSTEDGRKCLV